MRGSAEELAWTAVGLGCLDDIALTTMPIWALLYVIEHGGCLDYDVVSSYLEARMPYFDGLTLKWMRKEVCRFAEKLMTESAEESEDRILAEDAMKFADTVYEEIEKRGLEK